MLILCSIQSTLNPFTRESVLARIIGIIRGYAVSIVKAGFRSITFLLLQILNSISRTKCIKFSSQLPKWDLNKVLIIRASNINMKFDTWVISNYQLAYLMVQTMVNYYFCCFVQIISNAVITPLIESSLFVGKRFNPLFVFKRLKISVLFVVPLINAFESFPINQKLMPDTVDTRTQIINSQIQSNSFIRIDRCFYFLVFINILNLKPSSRVFWGGRIRVPVDVRRRSALRAASYLLDIFIFESFWQLDFYLAIFLSKPWRHWNSKRSIFEFNSGNNQRKISFFWQVSRQLWSLVTTFYRYSFKQSQERLHASVYYLHSLLSDVGIKQPIIFVRLAKMVIRFVGQTFSFSKEILSGFIQCHVEKIFTQASQSKQGVKFLFTKSSELVLLSGVHIGSFR